MVVETLMFQNILSHSDTNLFILKTIGKRENQLIKIQQHELKRSPSVNIFIYYKDALKMLVIM
jgi:hypothetical protein